jgi:hypothetical protein
MGRANGDLIKVAEKLRKLHGTDSHQYRKAAKLVTQSQEECAHDGEIRAGRDATGQPCRICMECSKVLEH